MATKWTYVGQVVLPSDVDAHIKTSWQNTLKAEQSRILAALTTKIGSSADFTNKIVTPSTTQYAAFLATVGAAWDRDTILLKQAAKLGASYTQWLASVHAVFDPAGTFPTIVDAKVGKLKNLRRTMAVVGNKSFGTWNAGTKAVLFFRGDLRVAQYLGANDNFTGTLEAGFDATLGRLLSPSLIAEIVYGCVMAEYANEAGLTTLRGTIITAANAAIASLMTLALDSGHKGGSPASSMILAWNAVGGNMQVTALCSTP